VGEDFFHGGGATAFEQDEVTREEEFTEVGGAGGVVGKVGDGGGGSGGSKTNPSPSVPTGGAGAQGVVIIEEFY
jgi:hypothetical protein